MTELLGIALAEALRYFLIVLEAICVFILVIIARRNPLVGDRWFRRIETKFEAFAGHRVMSLIAVGLLPLVMRLALLPIMPPRLPAIGDEFSYVLSGETLALGRASNPPHPMAAYLESPHILQRPTYMSMYFPAQGVFMAVGRLVTGSLWAGIWLSVGLMCASICWMLQGWLPASWALLGGVLAGLRLGIFGYWMNSYYGGAVAALGGALVLGSLPRILQRRRARDAALFALGLVILANTRPYEGLLISLPAAAALAISVVRRRPPLRPLLTGVVVPALLVLSAAGFATCYYYWRVTGSPFRLPQALQRAQYAIAPYFVWQSPGAVPDYHNQGLRAFYAGAEMDYYRHTRSLVGLMETGVVKLRDFWLFYLGPALTLPLILCPSIVKHKNIRFLLLAAAIFFGGLTICVWFYPHYAAPATALLYAVLLESMRCLKSLKGLKGPTGLLLVRGIPLICFLMIAARIPYQLPRSYMPPDFPMTWFYSSPGGVDRAHIVDELRARGGRHLVLVRWKTGDNPFEQWVYNGPEIDKADIVWAWELNSPDALLRYFRDRHVWTLRPAWHGPPTLSPYPGADDVLPVTLEARSH